MGNNLYTEINKFSVITRHLKKGDRLGIPRGFLFKDCERLWKHLCILLQDLLSVRECCERYNSLLATIISRFVIQMNLSFPPQRGLSESFYARASVPDGKILLCASAAHLWERKNAVHHSAMETARLTSGDVLRQCGLCTPPSRILMKSAANVMRHRQAKREMARHSELRQGADT
jgi:hypothetical protein